MCGRFSQGKPSRQIGEYFDAALDDDLPEGMWNVPPTERIRVVVERAGGRRVAAARWGFQPAWSGADARRSWINVRAEGAWESRAFGPALRGSRCVVPVDAFYEWDRSVSPRQPYAIGPAAGGELLALGGIWSQRRDGPRTVAILTTAPNAVVARVHDRMPVVISADAVDAWLDPATPSTQLAPMLAAPDVPLRMWPVSSAVNRVGTDGPGLLRPVRTAPDLGLV